MLKEDEESASLQPIVQRNPAEPDKYMTKFEIFAKEKRPLILKNYPNMTIANISDEIK